MAYGTIKADNLLSTTGTVDLTTIATDYVQKSGDTMTGSLTTSGDLSAAKGTFSTGVLFGTDTADANTLDDYEEGTFTPTLSGSGGSPSVTYNTTNTHGAYVKVGNLVTFTLEIRTESRTGGSGNLLIEGLPFSAASIGGSEQEYEFPIMLYNVTFDASYIYTAELVGVSDYIQVRGNRSGTSDANLEVSAWSNANPTLCRISGSYRVA